MPLSLIPIFWYLAIAKFPASTPANTTYIELLARNYLTYAA